MLDGKPLFQYKHSISCFSSSRSSGVAVANYVTFRYFSIHIKCVYYTSHLPPLIGTTFFTLSIQCRKCVDIDKSMSVCTGHCFYLYHIIPLYVKIHCIKSVIVLVKLI